MIDLHFEYLSVWCIWIYLIIMSCATFTVNPHSVVWLIIIELLGRSKLRIWSLSGTNESRTLNHLVRKWTLNHLVKSEKLLTCAVSTYLYGAFDCILLSCHVRVSVVLVSSPVAITLVSLFLTLNRFLTLLRCFHSEELLFVQT